MITRILTAIVLVVLSTAAQARCLPQTDMSPQGECGKPWPVADAPKAERSGFPEGRPQGHCWACMHGCTPENDAKFCGWNAGGSSPVETRDDRELARIEQIIKDFGSTECFRTGMPQDCNGWVGGPYGWTKP